MITALYEPKAQTVRRQQCNTKRANLWGVLVVLDSQLFFSVLASHSHRGWRGDKNPAGLRGAAGLALQQNKTEQFAALNLLEYTIGCHSLM